MGLVIRCRLFRRNIPDGVSTRSERGASAREIGLPGTGWASEVIHTSESSAIVGCSRALCLGLGPFVLSPSTPHLVCRTPSSMTSQE